MCFCVCLSVCSYVRENLNINVIRVNVRFKVTAWQFMETTIQQHNHISTIFQYRSRAIIHFYAMHFSVQKLHTKKGPKFTHSTVYRKCVCSIRSMVNTVITAYIMVLHDLHGICFCWLLLLLLLQCGVIFIHILRTYA